ncbi:dTDP-4-dehydrorhamnose reductase [Vibrio harveyi]|uniref:dTDP-4-dehydrorhamnose reductase n=1 Tax=Vibrio harveyi TaxID=669 RepID=UPI00165E0FA6|nr:dTDP-4-dehydrorhamnose reductase [Vibrio harveyi]
MLKKVLVTGSNGQVGRCLVERLTSRDDIELLAVDREQLDITNQASVDEVVSKFRPNFIINAAAYTAVDKAEEEAELSYAINEQGPKFLAEAANRTDAVILHISTDYVFEGNKDELYSEEDETNPQGVYGASKLAGELAVIKASPKHIILRTAWVFCEHGNNFVKTMLRLAEDRSELSIVGDQFGGPTYAGDIASALIIMVDTIAEKEQQAQFGIYHYSGRPYVSWFEFAECILANALECGLLEKTPSLSSITTAQYPTPAKRPASSKLNLNKIKRDYAIDASDWQKVVTNLIQYKGDL